MQMKRRYFKMILVLFWMLHWGRSEGQVDCNVNLESARRAYYLGDFNQVQTLLTNCVQGTMVKDLKKEGLKLLTNTNLILQEDEQARLYMALFLELEPNYSPNTGDLDEFRRLHEKFVIKTRYTLGITFGLAAPNYNIMRYHSIASLSDQPEDYINKIGFTTGITLDQRIFDNLFINGSINYLQYGYSQQETIQGYQRVSIAEKQQFLTLPIHLKYIPSLGRINPFISAGGGGRYLLAASGDIDHIPLPIYSPFNLGDPISVEEYDLNDQRIRWTWFYSASAGAQYYFGDWILELSAVYQYGFNNLTKNSRRYSDQVLFEDLAYVPDDFKLNDFQLKIGILRNFTTPKTIKP